MKPYSKYNNIILDFDGVIVDSNTIKKNAIYSASYGLKSDETHHEFVQYFIANNGVPREYKIKKYFHEDDFNIVLNKYNILLEKEQNNIELTFGTREFLEYIKNKDIKIFILSGGDKREIQKIIRNYKIEDYFLEIKSGPQTKEENLKSLKLQGKSLFIGDSKKDYETARTFNLDFIFMYGYTQFKEWKEYFSNKNILSEVKDFQTLTQSLKKGKLC